MGVAFVRGVSGSGFWMFRSWEASWKHKRMQHLLAVSFWLDDSHRSGPICWQLLPPSKIRTLPFIVCASQPKEPQQGLVICGSPANWCKWSLRTSRDPKTLYVPSHAEKQKLWQDECPDLRVSQNYRPVQVIGVRLVSP